MPDLDHRSGGVWRWRRGGGTDLSAYLPDFAAPAPIAFNRLTLGFTINPNVATNLATLLVRGAVRLTVLSNDATGEHGTTVVSVALGDSGSFAGTAPGATGIFGTFALTSQLTQLGVAALAQHAVAWNNSWGYTNLGLNQSGWDAAFSGTDGQSYLTALRNYAAWGVVVFAIDNADTGNSGLMDGLPLLDHSLESGWIAVANGVPTLVSTAVSAVYLLSSPCCEAARWCIVADGPWTSATGPGSDYAVMTGSSLAAPQVSGAVATWAKA